MNRALPLLVALVCALLMVGARLFTNRYCKIRGKEMVAAGTTSGFIPWWASTIYLLGMVGLALTIAWSFFSVAWWASIVVVALYFLTGLVHSRATDITALIRFNEGEIKTEVATAELQIEDLIRGIATGDYVRKVGSQFGSLWGFDGLIVQEATPEEYAAFNAVRKVKICHGRPVSWLGKEWSAILVYDGGKLSQVNIHTDTNNATFAAACARLELLIGQGQEVHMPQDIVQSVIRRFVWNTKDGEVSIVCTATFVQLSLRRLRW